MPLIKVTVLGGVLNYGALTEGITWYFDDLLEAAKADEAAQQAGFDTCVDADDFISDHYEFVEWLRGVSRLPFDPNAQALRGHPPKETNDG